MNMELKRNETLILDNIVWDSNKKLVLTNKRLLVYSKKSNTFSHNWELHTEIALEDIQDSYGMLDVFTNLSSLVIKLKNGDVLQFTFRTVDSQESQLADPNSSISKQSKETMEKYLKAIIQQITK